MKRRQARDVAAVTALCVLDLFRHLLREEEQRDAYAEILHEVETGFETYRLLRSGRMKFPRLHQSDEG